MVALLAVVAPLAVVGGCGAATPPVATPLPAAPEPAVSPPAVASLPGTVLTVGGTPEGVAVDASGEVALNVHRPDGVVLFSIAAPQSRRLIALGGTARHLMLAGADGPLLVPDESDDRLVELSLPGGQVEASVPVGRQPHDAVALASGTVLVADELANTVDFVQGGRVTHVVAAPLQPGGVAANPDGSLAVVVGVRARRLTEYRVDGRVVGSANCGAGPTHVVSGDDGLYWVADTNGGAILGFTLGAHGPTQVAAIPVGSRPYGLAFDASRDTLWVTLTGSNQLVGLHLKGRAVQSRTTYPTVRQPNTVAVDEATGELVVTGSAAPGQLQLLNAPTG